MLALMTLTQYEAYPEHLRMTYDGKPYIILDNGTPLRVSLQ